MKIRALVCAVAVLAAVPLVVFMFPQVAGGGASYAVLSGSMAPTFQAGDYIVVDKFHPGDELEVGDIVTFRTGTGFKQTLVTHRVIGLDGVVGTRQVRTQGDANPTPDANAVPEGRIVGVYKFHVPVYGRLISTLGQSEGKLMLIMVSLSVLILEGQRAARLLREGRAARAATKVQGAPPAMSPAVPSAATPAPGPPGAARPAPTRFRVTRRAVPLAAVGIVPMNPAQAARPFRVVGVRK